MRKILPLLLAMFLLLLPAVSTLADDTFQGDELIYNGDFSEQSEIIELPAGWSVSAYRTDVDALVIYMDEEESIGDYVAIECDEANDARLMQNVAVTPDTVYKLSCMVRTYDIEGAIGASLSIDNYAIDGSFCYSDALWSTNDWQELSLYFLTGPEQTNVNVALRLGGYSSDASGIAQFAQISMRACQETDAEVVDLVSAYASWGSSGGDSEKATLDSAPLRFTLMLAVTALGGLLFFWLYRRHLRFESAPVLAETEKKNFLLPLILAAAFLLRLILSLIYVGHSTDLTCFMAWGNAALHGTSEFYTSGMFADYPPGYMYICGALAWIGNTLGLSYGSAGYVFLFKLPATFADLLSAYLLYRFARKEGLSEPFALLLAGLVAFNPVMMFIAGGWGQIDSVLTLLLIIVCMLFRSDKRIAAGAVYGLAVLMKPQALMFGPLLAAAYILSIADGKKLWWRKLLETVLSVLAALAVLFLFSLPFKGSQGTFWLVEKYASTAGSYAYASIEAFNLFALIGGNWADVNQTVLGVSYKVLGTIGICISVAGSVWLYACGRKKNTGALFLCGALMLTAIFTLGHYMHERYLFPALLMLLFAYVCYRDRRILVAFGILTMTALLNALAAMYIVDHQSARGAYYNALICVGSLAELCGFVLLVWTCISITVKNRLILPKKTESPKEDTKAVYAPLDPVAAKEPFSVTGLDRILLGGLVTVYSVVALLNLGSLSAPESFWESQQVGETVEIAFDEEQQIGAIWFNGNIADGGILTIAADSGDEITFEQLYDDMFRWKDVAVQMYGSSVTLKVYSGRLCMNEIALFDTEGDLIAAHIVNAEGTETCLLDEQDTVPDAPSYFNGMYFDELYHGRTAYEHLHTLSPYENSHPPLGKIIISIGIAIFGMNPFGWRIMGALFGIAMLPVFFMLAKRMFRKSRISFAVTALFAFDFMHFTQTRIATIDVFVVFFILLMYYFMYRYISMNFFDDGLKKTLRPLALAGVCFGLGAACKWTGIYAGAGLAVLFFGSLIARYMEYRSAMKNGTAAQKRRVQHFADNTVKTLLWCCLFYIAVPLTIYFASYTPYFIYEAKVTTDYGFTDMLRTFINYQNYMFSYHSGLTATHPYQSAWYEWPFTLRPMWYFFTKGDGYISTLTASGNPAVWWVGTVASLVLLLMRLLKRIRPDKALQIICVGVLANFLPWVLVTRCTFIYHFFATVPFILLGAGYLLMTLETQNERLKWVKWAWLGVGLLLFILLYPGLSGLPISPEWGAFLRKLPGGGLMYGA